MSGQVVAAEILPGGSRNARCIWATPAFKNCIGGFRHCLSIPWPQKSSASDSLAMPSGPMGDDDHEPAIGSNLGIMTGSRHDCVGSYMDRRVWFGGDR